MDAADSAAVYARLAAQLDLAAAGAVLAGARRIGRARPARSASRGRTRRSVARLSTVDDVQSGAGRVAAVLALHEQLDGRAGSYGTGARAVGRRPRGVSGRRRPRGVSRRRHAGRMR